jgi:hypothetical protein
VSFFSLLSSEQAMNAKLIINMAGAKTTLFDPTGTSRLLNETEPMQSAGRATLER